jgi:drug/metabolite transporter (DMT)-like permease
MKDSMTHVRRSGLRGALCGLGSAWLFGVSAPLGKLLLPRVDGWVLAGLFYIGAGAGLGLVRVAQRGMPGASATRAPLQKSDLPMLLAIAVIGGGVGPVLLLFGLGHLSGVAGSLLLNLEAVFTMVLAVLFFGERLSMRETGAAAIVLTGAVLLTANGGRVAAELVGVAAIVGACLVWGLDNNLTARLSRRDAVDLVRFKATTAGLGNLILALASGRSLPGRATIAAALAVGFVCYGLSIVLDVYALRYVGAAREAAYFATAPFAGAIAAVPVLGERVGVREVLAAGVMAAGVMLLVRARQSQDVGPAVS